ncbi:hypothetical protein BKA24_001691 [Microbacterium marinum]|uniref:Uncharacterized protein n=1 Tax=Microbacterium marinum TaxID=421115 RepID=A0A7W7FIE2_9MICO|nr:hypothetical protein [Microbacterium marinum]MBB4666982.1 hypothetical protein [Microbacterium marinum]
MTAPRVTLSTTETRAKFERIREFSPKLARRLRRDMRRSGDEIIGEQRKILAGPLPRGIRAAGKRRRRVRDQHGRARFRTVNVYEETDTKRPGRSRGLRRGISDSLKTRVVFGKNRTAITVRTTGAKRTGATFWQAKRFRHKTFGREPYVDQQGQPYFWRPAYDGAARMAARVDSALDEALKEISDH